MDPDVEQQIQNDIPNSIKISIDKLQKQFECTICLNLINDAFVTRCGHVFCRACIEQAINRHHRCPFCSQQLKDFKLDVFKNYNFNTIKKIIDDQKKLQTSKYLNKVFATDMKSKMQIQNSQIQQLMKPIQDKIVQTCQNALLQYRQFLISMYYLQKEAEQKKALHGSVNIRDNRNIIKSLNQFVLEKFPSPIISPQIIQKPTSLHILLPGNKIHKATIKLAPMATFQSLLPFIDKICSENNIQLKGKISDVLIINGVQKSIKDKLGLLVGDLIKIQKGIPFHQKIYCFSYNWEAQKISSFYVCKTCSVKWICENCTLYCHAGHEYQIQLKNHKPDWAMCYCVSKCDCKALNKNRMEMQ